MRAERTVLALALSMGTVWLAACSPDTPESTRGAVRPRESTAGSGTNDDPGPSGETIAGTRPDAGRGASDDAGAGAPAPSPTGSPTNGFPAKWIDGTACAGEPVIQTWKYSDDTIIFRQSLCTTFEGPFMYLFVGANKALLVDTGPGGVDLRGAVTTLLAGKNLQLVVAHSHAHGDHVGGDSAFRGQQATTVVGLQPAAARQFFGITGDAAAAFDLGGRVVDVLAIPGHEAAHLAFYDRATKLLLGGDTLYPGRLYIDDWNAYRSSVAKLVAFVDAARPVSFILGGHIELPRSGADYPYGAKVHPNERALQLTEADLRELDAAVRAMGNTPKREVHESFIISP